MFQSPAIAFHWKAHTKLNVFAALLLAMSFMSSTANAAFIPLPGSSQFLFFNPLMPANVSYNATTQTLTGTVGSTAGGTIVPLIGPALVSDIVSTFSMVAQIDHSGIVHGGSFSLVGKSAALGVSSSATLLSGTILDGGDSGSGPFDFLGGLVSLDPAIQWLIGPVGEVALEFISGVFPLNFTHDFAFVTPADSPVIWIDPPGMVSEPPTAPLLGIFLLVGLGWLGYARRRNDTASA